MRSLILSSGLLAVALIGAPQVSIAQTSGDKPFCLRHESGALQCNYDTMAQCQQGREGRSVGGGASLTPGRAPLAAAECPRSPVENPEGSSSAWSFIRQTKRIALDSVRDVSLSFRGSPAESSRALALRAAANAPRRPAACGASYGSMPRCWHRGRARRLGREDAQPSRLCELLGLSDSCHAFGFAALPIERSRTIERAACLRRASGSRRRTGRSLLSGGRLALGLTAHIFGRGRLALGFLAHHSGRRMLRCPGARRLRRSRCTGGRARPRILGGKGLGNTIDFGCARAGGGWTNSKSEERYPGSDECPHLHGHFPFVIERRAFS